MIINGYQYGKISIAKVSYPLKYDYKRFCIFKKRLMVFGITQALFSMNIIKLFNRGY